MRISDWISDVCSSDLQERPMGATCFRAIARIAPMGRSCDAFRRRFPMTHSDGVPPGPDLAQGVPLADVPNGGVLAGHVDGEPVLLRWEEHTSELQSLMRISYAVFCL